MGGCGLACWSLLMVLKQTGSPGLPKRALGTPGLPSTLSIGTKPERTLAYPWGTPGLPSTVL